MSTNKANKYGKEKEENMLLYIKRDGFIVPYDEYEFFGNNILALYGNEQTIPDSYIIVAKNVKKEWTDHKKQSKWIINFPMIYNTDCGILSEDNLMQYGIEVDPVVYADHAKEMLPNIIAIKMALGIR